MSGTSMATPHVAGLAALIMEAQPGATIDQVEDAILASARRPSSIPPERGNHGIPNGPKALSVLARPARAAKKKE